jgi:hypothetical protein
LIKNNIVFEKDEGSDNGNYIAKVTITKNTELSAKDKKKYNERNQPHPMPLHPTNRNKEQRQTDNSFFIHSKTGKNAKTKTATRSDDERNDPKNNNNEHEKTLQLHQNRPSTKKLKTYEMYPNREKRTHSIENK